MTIPGFQAGALDFGHPENIPVAASLGGEDLSNDPGWLASDTSGLLEGKINDFGPGNLLDGISGSEDFSSALDDSSPDYSMFGHRLKG